MSAHQDADPQEQAPVFQPPSVEELGALLPSYEIHYLIASGGMGAVYKGLQTGLDRPVAIKILPPEAGNDVESLNRFRSEARAMAKLNHPNIISIYDFGEVMGLCYFIMELVEGYNVHELISQNLMTPEKALHIMPQVCEALAYAHGKGIIHGDIKPSNIVLHSDGTVKLLDFGLARLMDQSQHEDAEWTPMGTPEYAAPELYERGSQSDHRSDIYALGIVFYEMLVGKIPQGSFPLPSTLVRLDARVDEIVIRCLRPTPAERFGGTLEIKQLLEDIRMGKPLAPMTEALVRSGTGQRAAVRAVRPRAWSGPTLPGVVKGPGKPGGVPPTGAFPGPVMPGTLPSGRIAPPGRSLDRLPMLEAQKRQQQQQKKLLIGGVIALVLAILVTLIALNLLSDKGGPTAPKKDKPETVETHPPKVDPPHPETPKIEPKNVEPPKVVVTPPPSEPPPTVPPAETTPPPPTPQTETKPETPVVSVPPSQPGLPAPLFDPYAEKFPSLAKLKSDYVNRYRNDVFLKVDNQQRELGDKYLQALTKLEQEFTTRSDAAAILEIRSEKQRFEAAHAPPGDRELSKRPQIADLQRKLGTAFDGFKRNQNPLIARINNEFSEALARLQNQLTGEKKPAEAAATQGLREETRKVQDLVGVLAGFREPPPSLNPGTVEDGNVAATAKGAVAEAPTNSGGMIDGSYERENAARGEIGSTFTVTLGKVYRLGLIRLLLPKVDGHFYHYVVESTVDGQTWEEVEDRSKGEWNGLQAIKLRTPTPVKAYRIVAKGLVEAKAFLILETDAWCEGKSPPPPEPKKAN